MILFVLFVSFVVETVGCKLYKYASQRRNKKTTGPFIAGTLWVCVSLQE
jgi:hypothetical protein